MAAIFKISGAASLLLLVAMLLATKAHADDVTITTKQSHIVYDWMRLRKYPSDSEATTLWMNSCGLTEVNTTDVSNLPNLLRIDLTSNSLLYLNTAGFPTVPALTELRLERNKLREVPVFADNSCPSLTYINFEQNRLSALDDAKAFSACTKLKNLHFAVNKIEYIHPDIFSSLTNLEFLELNYNRIRYVPDDMLVNNNKLAYLNIDNNRITHLPPDFASGFKRAGAGLRGLDVYNNLLHCDCLLELKVDAKRANVRLNVLGMNWFDGSRPACVFISTHKYKCRDIRELSALLFNKIPSYY